MRLSPPALFLLTSLGAFRVTRLITTDTIPPVKWLRKKAIYAVGPMSPWSEVFTCPWCIGPYVSVIAVLVLSYFVDIQLPVFWMAAMSSVIGLISTVDSLLGSHRQFESHIEEGT